MTAAESPDPSDMKWRNLGEHTVYENPWLTVNLADVELPDGRHLDHYLIRQRPVAMTAAINDRHEVLLLWRHRFITDTWGWELPAGVVDKGETVEEAAAREMLEETGWRPGPLHHLITVEPSNGLSDAVHHVYWTGGATHVGEPEDDFESSRRDGFHSARYPISLAKVRSAQRTPSPPFCFSKTRPRTEHCRSALTDRHRRIRASGGDGHAA